MPSGLTFGAAVGQANTATAVITVVGGSVLSLMNTTSTGALVDNPPALVGDLSLPSQLGGTGAAVNAWISIEFLTPVVIN